MKHAIIAAFLLVAGSAAQAELLTGSRAFGDWRTDAPGVQRKITVQDIPAPYASRSASNPSRQARRPADAVPKVPPGFVAQLFAQGFEGPRALRTAPNGDIFVAETWGGRVLVLRPGTTDGQGLHRPAVFASGLGGVFGLALGPSRENPEFLYAAMPTGVVRFPYRAGELKASGAAQQIVRDLPGGGHSMRDLAFSPDGRTLYVSVGSLSNVAQGTGNPPADTGAYERARASGAAFGQEDGRAALLAFDADGRNRRFHATGLRNCSGLTVEPASGLPWCVVNERDGLGDDLPPDYASAVRPGDFFGWPWFYAGGNEDPRHKDVRPDLRDRARVPDVLFQAHSAPLGIAFYPGGMFPAEYRGDAFVTLHGSWNRAKRTGYKVVRLRFADGRPTGVYEDFMTGFVSDDASVWGRPVGVTIMKDGALLVSEDGGNTIWRVSHTGK